MEDDPWETISISCQTQAYLTSESFLFEGNHFCDPCLDVLQFFNISLTHNAFSYFELYHCVEASLLLGLTGSQSA